MTYDENDILRHVGARSLEAGRAYHRQGRVVHYENGGATIVAKVRGGRPRAYAQDIDISGSAAGKAKIRSDCSCPMGAAPPLCSRASPGGRPRPPESGRARP
jgi:uncharacterized Zn finger protein